MEPEGAVEPMIKEKASISEDNLYKIVEKSPKERFSRVSPK